MRHFRSIRILIVVAGLVSLMPGCSDDPAPPYEDKGTQDTSAGEGLTPDTAVVTDTTPDLPPIWPDIWPDTSDMPVTPLDLYVGAPFGCKTDADCFGQMCCPTLWGVSLCAPTCTGK